MPGTVQVSTPSQRSEGISSSVFKYLQLKVHVISGVLVGLYVHENHVLQPFMLHSNFLFAYTS